MESNIAMEGFSPVESIDSNADLFSNVALKLNSTSTKTNYDSNSAESLRTKREHVISKMSTWIHKWSHFDSDSQNRQSAAKTHRFRFWLNKKASEGSFGSHTSATPEEGFTLNTQASVYNHQFSKQLFSDDCIEDDTADGADETFTSQAAIYEFDNLDSSYPNASESTAPVIDCSTKCAFTDPAETTFISQSSLYHQFGDAAIEEDSTVKVDETFPSLNTCVPVGEISWLGAANIKPTIFDSDVDKPYTSGAGITSGFDDQEPFVVEISQKDEDFLKDIDGDFKIQKISNPRASLREIHDGKYYLESLQDVFILNGGVRNFFSVPLDRQSSIYEMRTKSSHDTILESLSETRMDSESSLEENEIRCNRTSDTTVQPSSIERRFRLKTLLHYLKNKCSSIRDGSEFQLLKLLWNSTWMSQENSQWYCRNH